VCQLVLYWVVVILSSPLRSVPTYIIHISPARANPSLDRLICSVLSAVQNSTVTTVRHVSSHIVAQVICYKLYLASFALPFFSLARQTCRPSKCHISAVFGGSLKHAMENGNFREFHTVAGGIFAFLNGNSRWPWWGVDWAFKFF